ncbi:MAG: hypothetical protein IID16_11225 [Candidatus Marinimicrobia bacterium]|nr:hypothetical protein [Candidatus Neomarinimicrobiota bacterium]
MNIETVKNQLKTIKLLTAASELDQVLLKHKKAVSLAWVGDLLEREIDGWNQVFPDPVLANATIDRIFDRADISLFKGKSYRLKGKIKVKNIDLFLNKK